jgi:hypothetical protein
MDSFRAHWPVENISIPYRVGEAGFRVVRVVRADKHTQQTMPQMAGGYLSSNRFHGKARE